MAERQFIGPIWNGEIFGKIPLSCSQWGGSTYCKKKEEKGFFVWAFLGGLKQDLY